jgi:hypothetical protein
MAASPQERGRQGPKVAATRAGELAGGQFGAIARRQLLACGFSPDRVKSWVRRGLLHPQLPGVFAFGREGLGTEGELAAALLYAGPNAGLGSISALWWQKLLGHRPMLIHIDSPRRVRSQPGLLVRQATFDRQFRRGLPVVPLPQALLAAASALTHDSLRLVLARAEFERLLDLRRLQDELRPGRTGTKAIRAALAAHLPQLAKCTNRLEIDFVLLCERYGIPIPEPNARIGRWRPDMLWREYALIVELDGADAHRTAAQLLADERRAADLRRRGFTVVRYTWDDVHEEPDAVAAELLVRLG